MQEQSQAQPSEEDTEAAWQAMLEGHWPFEDLCARLCQDTLSPAWTLRHGAAAGLRDILRSHAACAGVTAPTNPTDPGGEPVVFQSPPCIVPLLKA